MKDENAATRKQSLPAAAGQPSLILFSLGAAPMLHASSHFIWRLGILLPILVGVPRPTEAASPSAARPIAMSSESTIELATRFREYRVAVQDESSPLRPALRHWNGPMHAVMSELAKRLGAGHSSKEVISLLGPPNETLRLGRVLPGHTVPPRHLHLVYWWRGGHDYLYFVVRSGIVQSTDWWYAGE